ncbi:hypothetical protein J1614_002057 [Plenodomus biglobosus]|nr:hypothetical protein J1614_002057 [Plenodomus biglobosus]
MVCVWIEVPTVTCVQHHFVHTSINDACRAQSRSKPELCKNDKAARKNLVLAQRVEAPSNRNGSSITASHATRARPSEATCRIGLARIINANDRLTDKPCACPVAVSSRFGLEKVLFGSSGLHHGAKRAVAPCTHVGGWRLGKGTYLGSDARAGRASSGLGLGGHSTPSSREHGARAAGTE